MIIFYIITGMLISLLFTIVILCVLFPIVTYKIADKVVDIGLKLDKLFKRRDK